MTGPALRFAIGRATLRTQEQGVTAALKRCATQDQGPTFPQPASRLMNPFPANRALP